MLRVNHSVPRPVARSARVAERTDQRRFSAARFIDSAPHADRGTSPRHLRGGLPSGSPPAPRPARTVESLVNTSGRAEDLPAKPSGIRKLLLEEEAQGASPEFLARMAVAIRGADVVIAGSLSDEDRGIRGLLPHLADLSSNAYRVLLPAPLIGHAGFAQLAKKFQYVQMSHEEARRLAAGASDLGILTQVLRKRLGEGGEFAITYFGGHGVLWADNKEWEIEPIAEDDADKPGCRRILYRLGGCPPIQQRRRAPSTRRGA